MTTTPYIPTLAEAVTRAGSVAKLAAMLGVSRQLIYKWKRVPAERVREIERLTGVPRETLRPDLYELGETE